MNLIVYIKSKKKVKVNQKIITKYYSKKIFNKNYRKIII
jgi:hypothetical protein